MDNTAVEAASASLKKAKASLESMRAAKSHSEFESAWTDFLMSSGRIFTKLEQGAKTNNKSVAWFGTKRHDRRKDPLLCYIHHARNVDEHGLIPVSQLLRGGIEIRGKGTHYIENLVIEGGEIKDFRAFGDPLIVQKSPDTSCLIPVIDRGTSYDVPTEHMGKAIDGTKPMAVAETAVSYFEGMISEAEKLV